MKSAARLWVVALCCAAVTATAEEQTPEGLFSEAQKLEQENKISRAVDRYQHFLKEYPNHSQTVDVRYRLAKGLDSIGRIDEAIEQLEKVVEPANARYRNRQEALYALGKLLGSGEQFERAVAVLDRLLAEGAGLYEDEVLNMCGGYYGALKKFNEAAAKFNVLKRRTNSKFAEEAAQKLVMIWIKAGNMELAIEAVSDLASRFPQNQMARTFMLQIADSFRQQKRYDQALALCEQLKTAFPKSFEGQAAGIVRGLVYRDRKEFDKATQALEEAARQPDVVKSGTGAEAIMTAAGIYYSDLTNTEKAMERFEEAANIAREYGGENAPRILEECYFRLAENAFAAKKWAVALEFYSLLRKTGTKANILPRILKCQAELGMNMDASLRNEQEVEYLKKKIADNPGTFAAAEGETFLADREMTRLNQGQAAVEAYTKLAATYQDILKRYPASVLAEQHLHSYLWVQLGRCQARAFDAERKAGMGVESWKTVADTFEKALSVDPDTPYRQEVLEYIARVADAAGQTEKSFKVYQELYELTGKKFESSKGDKKVESEMVDYLKGMLTRAEKKDSIEDALALTKRIIEKEGQASPLSRNALLYMGELYYLRKDFSESAKTFREFIRIYGPKQNSAGDVEGGPWKPAAVDEVVQQVYEAAVRVAHSWYLQGHGQNMIKAYDWMVRNFPYQNRWNAEARYWLAMEWTKGEAGKTKENKQKLAAAMWQDVVHPSLDFGAKDYNKGFHFWLHDKDANAYVRCAIMKAGETWNELAEYEKAAAAFEYYLDLFPPPREDPRNPQPPDDKYPVARYALGMAYIKLQETPKLFQRWKPYLGGLRDDRFRSNALLQLGYHAAKVQEYEMAADAYGTVLDEYGTNPLDDKGKPIPIPHAQWVRKNGYGWNGIRIPPPESMDLGDVRFSLGYLYWKQQDWAACAKALTPFVTDAGLASSKVMPKALFMTGQSYYKVFDYKRGSDFLLKLIRSKAKFDAIEEAYAKAAMGCCEAGMWKEVHEVKADLLAKFPQSSHRPHVDLYAAVATLHTGKVEDGVSQLKQILESDTFEDVKAAAAYYLGMQALAASKGSKDALRLFKQSVDLYPTGRACLEAGKGCVNAQAWEEAETYLGRAIRDFPSEPPQIRVEAERLRISVLEKLRKPTN